MSRRKKLRIFNLNHGGFSDQLLLCVLQTILTNKDRHETKTCVASLRCVTELLKFIQTCACYQMFFRTYFFPPWKISGNGSQSENASFVWILPNWKSGKLWEYCFLSHFFLHFHVAKQKTRAKCACIHGYGPPLQEVIPSVAAHRRATATAAVCLCSLVSIA